MWLFKTLRARFAFWVAGLLLVTLAVFSVSMHASLARGLAAAIDDSLVISATQAVAAVNFEDGELSFADAVPGTAAAELRERGLTIRVLDPSGHLLEAYGPYRNLPIDMVSVDTARNGVATFATLTDPASGDDIRFRTTPIIVDNDFVGILQVAQTLDDERETLERLSAALLASVPFFIGTAGLGGYLLARRALAPVDQITRTARRIGAEDLHARLNLPASDDEIGRLATTFDEMIARLDDAFERQRRFTTDAAHELRTPLTAMQLILSVTRTERRTSEEYEQALDDLTKEADRLRSLVESLLTLARNDDQHGTSHDTIDLSTLVWDVTDALGPLAEAKGLVLTCSMTPGVTICGDRDDIIRLLMNVVDNAIKYTENGSITICGETINGKVHVAVTDTGIGIGSDHLSKLFDRFYRVETARTRAGAGLGLAIAREIARAHDGTIEVKSVENSGSTFTTVLPLQSPSGVVK
jgi:heavy metal sensor kinase